jgi:hypothetical protein
MYTPSAYFCARIATMLIAIIWYPLVLTSVSVWFYDLPYMTVKGFCEWWGILTIICLCGSAFGMMIGALVPKSVPAQLTITLFIVVFDLGAGFLANSSDSTWLVNFICLISPMNYGCNLLLRRLLQGRP